MADSSEVVRISVSGEKMEVRKSDIIPSTPSPAKSVSNDLGSLSRKQLSKHFAESDERDVTRGYPIGNAPVNLHGKPITDLSKTGGWIAALLIFGNEMAERLAYFGLAVNMVAFMFNVMHQSFQASANAVNNFLGISQVSSIVGGFIADAYLGRYWTIAIFATIYLVGLTGLTIGASVSAFKPSQANCDTLAKILGACEKAKPWQIRYLYGALYFSAFGAAGIRPCVSSFGADQFDERDENYKFHLDRFFNFFYLSITIGAIMAFTLVIYIQMEHGWGSAFGFLAAAMGISNALFFMGTPLYRHKLPGGSPFTRVTQVLVAAFRKRNLPLSSSEFVSLYEVAGKSSSIKGSNKILHTDDFRFLDKAALRTKEDGSNPDPWRLCTVTQVEEVKILVKLIPIPATTIMVNVILSEYLTTSVQQGYTLNTHMKHFKLPIACMFVFPALAIFIVLTSYYAIFVPITRWITGHPRGASQLQRVGIGLVASILSVAWAGAFERYRRHYAIKHGFEFNFLTAMPDLSAYWLLIQYALIGIGEVFSLVGLIEFLYQESPDAMKSIGSAYCAIAGGLGCFASTILNNIINSITGDEEKGRISWLYQNINLGRFDYFYWLLTVMSAINFVAFLFLSMRYKYRVQPGLQMKEMKPSKPVTGES